MNLYDISAGTHDGYPPNIINQQGANAAAAHVSFTSPVTLKQLALQRIRSGGESAASHVLGLFLIIPEGSLAKPSPLMPLQENNGKAMKGVAMAMTNGPIGCS